ncbi:DUF6615 family protein [Pseudoneobacillus sp. C159]
MRIDDAFKRISKKIWDDMFWLNKGIEEKAITVDILKELKKMNSDRLLAIKGVNEGKIGADIEWWIVFPGNDDFELEAVHMRIQAKRLHKMDDEYRYKDLDHKDGKQLENLIKEASIVGAIPLYCFYNYYTKDDSAYDKVPVEVEDGWRYAYASDIKEARNKNFSTYNHLSTIDPLTIAMYELAILAEKNPNAILLEYKDRDGSISISELVKKELPEYVFDELEDYEYPNGAFFKDRNWFPKITKRRRKNKTEKSNRTIKGRIRQYLDQLLSYMSFNKVNRPNLIITITSEPIDLDGNRRKKNHSKDWD